MSRMKTAVALCVLVAVAGTANAQLTFVPDPNSGWGSAIRFTANDTSQVSYSTANGKVNVMNFLTESAWTDLGAPAGKVVNMISGVSSSGTIMAGLNTDDQLWMKKDGTWSQVTWSTYPTPTAQNDDFALIGESHHYVKKYTFATGEVSTPLAGSGDAELGRLSSNGMNFSQHNGAWDNTQVSIDQGSTWRDVAGFGARDINDAANMVGQKLVSGWWNPVFYDYATDTVQDIPMPSWVTGNAHVTPMAMNNNNVVIGDIQPEGESRPTSGFIWDAVNGTRNINDVIDDEPSYGQCYFADINDLGWISGSLNYASGFRGFVALSGEGPAPKNRGDVTEDDFVGADDLVRILTHWGESGSVPWENGDCAPYGDGSAPGDDFVGADDYVEVLTYWGTDYSSPEPAPEPATLGLLLLGGLAMLRRRK